LHASQQVIGHWATPAPELKLLPANLFPCLEDIIKASSITPTQLSLILTHSMCLAKLLQHCTPGMQAASGALPLSSHTVALLNVMLRKSRACVDGKTPIVPRPWQSTQMPFKDMLCTGTFGPDHPAVRRLPFFKYDHVCKQGRQRYAKNRDKELDDTDSWLREQSQRMGSTCQKHKTRQTALSSGVFTMICNRCGMIEYFELMCQPESPATPARALFHRSWRPADRRA